ncbi:hypothetical protein ZIOFF_032441 [Zingiber officinale]|uniref:E3 ubiquitin-protein ligase TRIP12-like TPR repeats domain-containing protein n=1 Tax=Zingiber officinale TaxID=94328 RepID=A0A8J5GMR7_ZINOF|nr:hypothetical protein ZIOFF_032441 [Zingiber officinale]
MGRLHKVLVGLADEGSAQLSALTELCEVLSFCMEDAMEYFPVESTVPPLLVKLVGHENDIMIILLKKLQNALSSLDNFPVIRSQEQFLPTETSTLQISGMKAAPEMTTATSPSIEAKKKLTFSIKALKPALLRAAKKSFDEVAEDYKRATTYNNKLAIFYTGKGFCYIADDSRLTMARVCVEIDLLKPKIEDFWIGIGEDRRLQKVIYERQPKYCLHCQHLGHSVEECYGNGYHPNLAWGVGKQNSATVVSLIARVGKQVWIPREKSVVALEVGSVEGFAVENSFQILENLEENVLDLHNLDIRDREEELIVNKKMIHEEVGVHVSYRTKAFRRKGVAMAEISRKIRSDASLEEEEDISKSFVEMEDLDLDLDNLVIKKGSSSLNDESGGGAVRQGLDWDPGIHNMMTRRKTQMFMHRKISSQLLPSSIFISVVYAKCNSGERRILWERLLDVKPIDDVCWLVGGDFSVLSNNQMVFY